MENVSITPTAPFGSRLRAEQRLHHVRVDPAEQDGIDQKCLIVRTYFIQSGVYFRQFSGDNQFKLAGADGLRRNEVDPRGLQRVIRRLHALCDAFELHNAYCVFHLSSPRSQ